ncbi:formate dehydrogenase protein fdhE [Desulfurococcaceae archaeon AG1]|jgi:predicted transport protein|nr:MAG: hypothetical protein DJ555_07520 [Desulfurococcaceae archaeon]GAY25076.1 formate dehydrogenase protein fdhE [Desulfurococcaceae archaeon AG1]
MARIPCGSNTECQGELKEYLELYEHLHKSIESLNINVEAECDKYPLIECVRNIQDLARKATEILAGLGVDMKETEILENIRKTREESEIGSLASYVFRRIVFRGLRDRVKNLSWSSGKCPVCGLTPIAAIARRTPHGFFSQLRLELHCLCGFSWSYEAFKCPLCGNTSRDKFEVIMINSLKIQRCVLCNHAVAIVDEGPLVSGDLVHVIMSYSMMKLASTEKHGSS